MDGNQLSVVYFAIVLLYLAEYGVLFFGTLKATRKSTEVIGKNQPQRTKVTVLVCARDEEENIDACIRSLSEINYPVEDLELLIVDDKSKDRTPEILAEWQRKLSNLNVLRTGEEIANLKGKVNALTQGLDVAKGEIVLITDADSTVTPECVNAYLSHYEKDTGLVASVTLLQVNSLFDGIQSIDWAYLLGMASASANIGIPLSVIGNNMSIRKEAYDAVGGYRKIPFSVTEDHALFEAIWNRPEWKVKFPVASELLVLSKATPDLKSWWRQKHRWVKGGQDLKFVGYMIFIIGLLGNLAMFTALFTLPLCSALWVVAIKWIADLLVIVPILIRTRKLSLFVFFPLYEIYLALFVFSMPVMIMQKKVKWKGRVYQH